ncbi:putative cytochrome P450 [Helianthus annuus]|nr:putative cytochrome P450 [Helianthus annuus]
MYPATVAVLLLVLTGIFFWRWWSTHLRHKNLPPGPVPLPVIGSLHLLGSLPHRSLHKLSQKYGPIMSVRLGSVQFVIVSSPDAAKLFLGTHDIIFASRPQIQAAKYLSYDNKGMTFSEYGPYWRSIGLMVEEMKAAAKAHKVVNLSETVSSVIEGMVCRMLFGKKNDERFVFKTVIDESMEATGIFNLADYVPMLAPFDLQGLTKRFKSLSKELDEMFEILIDEHEKRNQASESPNHDQMDFIDILLSLKQEYSNTHDNLSYTIDRSNMKAILLDMVAGAIDTAKTSIEWILSVLIKHPRVMKELQKELKTMVGDKLMVEESDLTRLRYLHMAFGRDPKVWSDNWDEFLPERFLDNEIDFRGHDFKLIQFGIGRRGCPGMNLGLLNIGLVVSNMVHWFDWELPNGMSPTELDMKEKFGLTTPREKPLLAIPTYLA